MQAQLCFTVFLTQSDLRISYFTDGNTVKKTFWFIQWPSGPDPIDLTQDPNYSQRVNYLGDDQHNCTFSIRNLTEMDSTLYRFRFKTNTNKWASEYGVTLSVTGLQVTVNQNNVTEGQNVTLTCRTNCSLSDPPTFIWYKNGNPTPNTNPVSSVLYLLSVSSEDSGNYSCAVGSFETLLPLFLNVNYSPKNTSVSVSPSGDIVEGSSVTLTCSSKANPPVYRYTWFKKKVTEISQKGSGQSYTITNITSEDSGQYYCNSENTYGAKNSSQVDVNVRCKWFPSQGSNGSGLPGSFSLHTGGSKQGEKHANIYAPYTELTPMPSKQRKIFTHSAIMDRTNNASNNCTTIMNNQRNNFQRLIQIMTKLDYKQTAQKNLPINATV
uniref:B-cell receptor CD22 n=1 Tax=Scleropages formosus TaxID=113540 RepID=A0A8C9QW85_SCLFO